MGEIVQPYVASNMKELSDKFSEWYFGVKESTGNTPLAMQIFYWFSTKVRVNIFDYDEGIKNLEKVIEVKEQERRSWAEMCIKKQTTIESLNIDFHRIHENLVLGNPIEANKIALQAIGEIPK